MDHSFRAKFARNENSKHSFFYVYSICTISYQIKKRVNGKGDKIRVKKHFWTSSGRSSILKSSITKFSVIYEQPCLTLGRKGIFFSEIRDNGFLDVSRVQLKSNRTDTAISRRVFTI